MKTQAKVQVGQRYTGWGKTWQVISVSNGVAEAVNVDREDNKIRWPISKFKELTRSS